MFPRIYERNPSRFLPEVPGTTDSEASFTESLSEPVEGFC